MLSPDGVYVVRPDGALCFRRVREPISAEFALLPQALAWRIGRYLERQGLLERDAENSYLAGDALESGAMGQLLGSSILGAFASLWLHRPAEVSIVQRLAVGLRRTPQSIQFPTVEVSAAA